MAPLNFKETGAGEKEFQKWIIEDSWDGTIYLEARVIRTWQGLCGTNKLLEDREGHFFWWAVLFAPEGGLALQRIVTFLDWDSMAAELGITEMEGKKNRILTSALH
jgi:hypothetical protein